MALNKPGNKAPKDLLAGDPYCGKCGYALVGATEAARCPECGAPLVDALQRKGNESLVIGRRYRSGARVFGLPVIDIAFGPDARTGERVGRPRGLIALGDFPRGGIAVGAIPVGIVAVGGMPVGVVSLGGMSAGLLAAAGGMAFSLGMSMGGVAVGALSAASLAAGYAARGAVAVGVYAQGPMAKGAHVVSRAIVDPIAQQQFADLAWFFGGQSSAVTQPALCYGAVLGAFVLVILAIAAMRLRAFRSETGNPDAL